MGYKGGDLDLRTPHGAHGTAGGEPGRAPSLHGGGQRTTPIWVDDTVMACCNQAFDLAAAHRSEHVGLEHLLHAMTLVPGAAAWLEQQGARVAVLRRDTAALVAGDAPDVLSHGSEFPSRSAELEQVLKVAGQHAYARQRPASMPDLVAALLDPDLKGKAAALLRQHAAGTPLGMRSGPSREGEARKPRERVRVAAVTQQSRQAPSARPREDAARQQPDEDYSEATGSGGADAEAWARSERALTVVDRTALVRGGYDADLAISVDGLRAIESFDRKFTAIEDALNAVVERLAGIEREAQGTGGREAGESDLISVHLAAVEQALAALPAGAYLREIDAKFEALESRSNDITTSVALMDERLAAVETATWAHKGLSERLHAEVSGLSESIARQRGEIIAAVTDSVLEGISAVDASLGQRLAEGVGAVTRISDRLMEVEAGLRSDLEALSGSLSHRDQELAVQVATPLMERIDAVDASLAQRHAEGFAALETLGERLAQIEAGFATLSRTSPEGDARLASELGRVRDELSTVNSNQKTIASSMDLWRETTMEDLGSISNRLEMLERLSARTAQFIEALVLSVQDLHLLATRSEERRNRLGKWLFGMDDAFEPDWKPGSARALRSRQLPEEDAGEGRTPGKLSLGGAFRALRKVIGSG